MLDGEAKGQDTEKGMSGKREYSRGLEQIRDQPINR